ncbi:hypothetical protein JCGZ_01668 [Jatropha curcas]|uniref:Uncharacterized protein n=1 Tax=Jatropha curcas TaxID=180498 RepID=A0A067JST5_JATCU|nr:hypothetical protein JCGZ_01668 [Jatropha curcas]
MLKWSIDAPSIWQPSLKLVASRNCSFKVKLATLKVKGATYIPSSAKPKNVKHTAGKHRTHGKKPPLHPSSKRPESSFETVPAQNLRSSKRLRTGSKPL